jgi:hypothetical protein
VETKSEQIRRALSAGDHLTALRIASRFHDRSHDTRTFKRGLDAYLNPAFYRQLGKDPEQLTAAALSLLEIKFRRGAGQYAAEQRRRRTANHERELIKR